MEIIYQGTFQKLEEEVGELREGAFYDLPREGRRFVFMHGHGENARMTTTTPVIAVERDFVDGMPHYRFVTRNSIYQVKVTKNV